MFTKEKEKAVVAADPAAAGINAGSNRKRERENEIGCGRIFYMLPTGDNKGWHGVPLALLTANAPVQ